jgi:hypothetical protein
MQQYEIIRAKHTPENSTTINKKIFYERMPADCVGTLLFLFAIADKANPQPIDLEESVLGEELHLSKRAMRKVLIILRERGYVVCEPNGRFVLPASVIAENTLYLTAAEIEAWDNEVANQK